MKLKLFVGIALTVALFLAGNIFIFGIFHNDVSALGNISSKDTFFPLAYFFFCVAILSIFAAMAKGLFRDQGNYMFMLYVGVILCSAMTFTAMSFRGYNEKSTMLSQLQFDSVQMDNLSITNDYYTRYIDYLNAQVAESQKNSTLLQEQINKRMADMAAENAMLQKALQQAILDAQTPAEPLAEPAPVAVQEQIVAPAPAVQPQPEQQPERQGEWEEYDDD